MCSSSFGRYGCGSFSTVGLSIVCRACWRCWCYWCGRWGILLVSFGVKGKISLFFRVK